MKSSKIHFAAARYWAIAKYSAYTLLITFWFGVSSNAQEVVKPEPVVEKKWYDQIRLRGYAQLRYNRLLETNPKLKCESCDKSIGENGGFFFRRIRLVFFGQISKNVYFYIQPDFASSASATSLHFGQIRDAYVDVGLTDKNELKIRLGQSKVPYGFANMQSSQNRLTLDRDDALNSAVPNERDLGVMIYYTPDEKQKLYSHLVKDGLKGSGDYGILGFGVYNGQSANKPELNNSLYAVARASYPFTFGKQIIEASVQGYSGRWTQESFDPSTVQSSDRTYIDKRAAVSLILYPQPFGIQAEYNIGKGPQFNKTNNSIEERSLKGGYATFSYIINNASHILIPFVRYQFYDGGKKSEVDARSYLVKETEIGVEWSPVKSFELTAMYTISSRRFEDFKVNDNLQEGNLLRIQAQVNF